MQVRALVVAVVAAFAIFGCLTTAYYQRGDTGFEEFEAPQEQGECASSDECVVSGCQRERCTSRAAAGDSPCDLGGKPAGECGCVQTVCVWHN